MANIVLTIPDEVADRVVSALCKAAGVGVSPGNAKRAVIDFIKRTVADVEESEARQVYEETVVAVDVEGIVT